jgi:hypothetical protein
MKYLHTILGLAAMAVASSCSFTPSTQTKSVAFNATQDSVIVTYQDCNPSADDCSYFAAYFPVFPEDAAALNKFVNNRKAIISGYFDSERKSLHEAADAFILSYDTFLTSFPESAQSWYTRTELTVDSSFNGIVQFSEYYEDYTGGAHGNYSAHYFLVKEQTGSSLILEDIVAPGALVELTARITQAYRQQEGVESGVPLSEYGLFVDQIEASDNFYISGNSLWFLYNPYEIAPYSAGVIEVGLPIEETQHLFKEEFKAYLVVSNALS